MLTDRQRKNIRFVNFYKMVSKQNNEFIVPTYTELKNEIYKRIYDLGFSKIERVEPAKANCIIRLFQPPHSECDNSLEYAFYGATCFTQESGKWITMGLLGHVDYKINYSNCFIRLHLSGNDYLVLDCEFFDCYVKIS